MKKFVARIIDVELSFYYLKHVTNPAHWLVNFQGSLDSSKAESMIKNLQMTGRYLRDVWWLLFLHLEEEEETYRNLP